MVIEDRDASDILDFEFLPKLNSFIPNPELFSDDFGLGDRRRPRGLDIPFPLSLYWYPDGSVWLVLSRPIYKKICGTAHC